MRKEAANLLFMEELYKENAKIVYYFLFRICHDRTLAEDLTQETFLQAIKSIHRYDYSCKITVWLCQIAKHLYYQYLRKYGREIPDDNMSEEKEENPLGMEEMVLYKCELMDVIKEMGTLPEKMREVIYFRVMGDLSFREIGEMLGKSENWARVTFYRGKEKLLKARNKYGKD